MNENYLSIGFIGAGRVGCTLGRYFYEKNLEISGYFSNCYEHACEAAAFTHSKSYKTMKELAAESDILFLTVPDTSIYEVYLQLKDCALTDKILCHCSGALSAEIFKEIASVGAYGYSLHPAFAIHNKEHSYKELSKAFFTVEGSPEKMPVIEALLRKLGNPYQIIRAEDKCRYHASLVLSSNLVIGLYHIALGLLRGCGFNDLTAAEVLNPLFLNNAENICNSGCVHALTGPIDRNDIATVQGHLSAIDSEATRELYQLLSKELIRIAEQKCPDRDYSELENILNKESDHI